jgi:hypothetical protein
MAAKKGVVYLVGRYLLTIAIWRMGARKEKTKSTSHTSMA